MLVFVAAILQVSVFSDVTILHGTPDLLLVTIICVALLRGPVVGAVVGFWGGLLIDTANLGTLGVTSLLLTVAGYWIGRYGETTGRDRSHAPFVSVAVVTLPLRARLARVPLHARRPGARARRALEHALPGDRAQPDPDLAGLRARHAASCCRSRGGASASRGSTPLASTDRPPRRALPPARPAGRGAVPLHAADGAARRDPRGDRARRLRGALPAAVVAADPLRLEVRAGGARTTRSGRSRSRRRAGRSSTARGGRSSRTSPARPSRSSPVDLPKQGRYAEMKRLSMVLNVPLPKLLAPARAGEEEPARRR